MMVHNIRSPVKRAHSSPKKAIGMEYIIGYGRENLFQTLVWNVTNGAGHGTPSNSIGTPVPPGTQKLAYFAMVGVTKLRLVTLGSYSY